MNSTRRTQTFIGAMVLAAAASTGYAGFLSHSLHLYYGLGVLALAAGTSRMKVKLPGIDGNMSVNLPFLLTAVVSLSTVEAVAITGICTVVQCWPQRDARFKPQQLLFNLAMMAFASSTASLVFHSAWLRSTGWSSAVAGLILTTAALFLGQTAPVATVIGLSEGRSIAHIWWNLAQLSFPYYVVSAGVTSLMQSVSHRMGWGVALAVFPVMYASIAPTGCTSAAWLRLRPHRTW
ncbi:MAG: hypothetical protein LAO24_08515 [Acidobacteriia bacterium]|nr:hypothetical protein [Terriglobia bacterium]